MLDSWLHVAFEEGLRTLFFTAAFFAGAIIRATGVETRREADLALVRRDADLYRAFYGRLFRRRLFQRSLPGGRLFSAGFFVAVRLVAESAANAFFAALFGVFGALDALAFGGVAKRSRKL